MNNLNTAILNIFPDPVILLNEAREIIFANKSAEDLLSISYAGRDLALSFRHPAVLTAADEVLGGVAERQAEISLPPPIARHLLVQIVALESKEGDTIEPAGATILLVFQDVTAAKVAEQMRQDFVANVSHELRSPISSLSGFIETLQGPAKDDEEAREKFLGIMGAEAARMARLIDDLLSLSRVETGEHVRPQTSVSVSEIINMTRELLGARATEHDMTIEISADDDLPVIPGDQDELMEVFQNLMDNAVKYGESGTTVSVALNRIDRLPDLGGVGVAVSVENHGPGIAPEHLPRLTERFYRADKGRSRKMGGTGLGLAIVKHIVNRHRGKLVIESERNNKTVFTVYLPST